MGELNKTLNDKAAAQQPATTQQEEGKDGKEGAA